jgi:solute:Na+ symporter, SSS family
MFTVFDYALLFLYLAVLTGIGVRYYRRTADSSDFFVGGRKMSWLPVAISIIASDTSAITLLGNPGYSYQSDIRLILYVLGYSAAAWLVIWIFIPFYCRLNMVTAYEYLEKRFDVRVRSLTSILFLFIRGSHVSIAMYAPCLILTLVSGVPLGKCILLMGIFTTLYTTLGGIRAVIWNDVIQFSVVMTGIALAFAVGTTQVDGGLGEVMRIGADAGKFKLFDFSLDPASSVNFWAMFIGGTSLALATMGTDQAVLQRFFTAKSEAECKRSLKAFSVIVVPFQVVLLLLGVVLFAYYHQHPADAAQIGSRDADAVLGFFAVQHLPRFVTVLLVGAILAASMAVMSAGINSLSTCTVIDFHKRFWATGANDLASIRAGRCYTVIWGVLTTVGALYAGALGQLATAFAKIQGYVGGVMLGIFLLGIFFRRSSARGALIGGMVGMAVVSYVAFWTSVSFFWYAIIGGGATMLSGYLVSFFSQSVQAVPDELLFGHVQRRAPRSAAEEPGTHSNLTIDT